MKRARPRVFCWKIAGIAERARVTRERGVTSWSVGTLRVENPGSHPTAWGAGLPRAARGPRAGATGYAYLKRHPLVREAIWTGRKLVKAIGYDAGSRDTARSRRTYKSGAAGDKWEAAHVRYWYPLQEWGWTRERCESEIRQAGLYVPPKSSCFFCPAMRPAEVLELRDEHPDLFARGVAMEERARDGRHGLKTTKGLGRNFAWADLAGMPAQASKKVA
jgi:hypothetical protein